MHVARKIHSRPPLRKYIRGHNLAGITRVVRAGTTVIYPVEMEKKKKRKSRVREIRHSHVRTSHVVPLLLDEQIDPKIPAGVQAT